MENNNANSQFTENNLSRVASTSSSKQWSEKKREHSPEAEWSKNKIFNGRSGENENKNAFKNESQTQQPLMQAQFSAPYAYGYGATDVYDHNQSSYPMIPSYNMYSQWPPVEGVPTSGGHMPVNSTASMMPVCNGVDMVSNTSSGMNPYPYMGMPPDPTMYGMVPNFVPFPVPNGMEPSLPPVPKVTFTHPTCSLYPPRPNAPAPSTREKPPGCKTVFVGGLPEKITEEIVREMFQQFGEILTVRMSKKNFCHIRFSEEAAVERALYLSGYRLKIENKDEQAYSGRLHVDYAVARDDQYEYECRERAAKREERHKARMEQQACRPPTPPPIAHYSELEATSLGENLRNEETFKKAVQVLITWLERGECTKRNSGTFYSMIQSTNSHVRRLQTDKQKCEEEVEKAKKALEQKTRGISLECNDIEKVFKAATLQKVWDHFTKPQRKNIESWKQSCELLKNTTTDELITNRIEDEMDVSDEEDASSPESTPAEVSMEPLIEERNKLREEVSTLQNQLTSAKLDGEEHKQHVDKLEMELEELKKEKNDLKEENRALAALVEANSENKMHNDNVNQKASTNMSTCVCSPGVGGVTENETRFIALISTFLNVHPFGASIDYICSYLIKMDASINTRDIECLMRRFPTVFKEESTGIGATLEKKWTFLGFKF